MHEMSSGCLDSSLQIHLPTVSGKKRRVWRKVAGSRDPPDRNSHLRRWIHVCERTEIRSDDPSQRHAVAGLAPSAGAQVIQDGLVNVNIEDVTVTVPVAVAAQLAVNACGIDVGPLAIGVLARATAVDRSGRTHTICRT